jgi:hypothetical protein
MMLWTLTIFHMRAATGSYSTTAPVLLHSIPLLAPFRFPVSEATALTFPRRFATSTTFYKYTSTFCWPHLGGTISISSQSAARCASPLLIPHDIALLFVSNKQPLLLFPLELYYPLLCCLLSSADTSAVSNRFL